MKWPRAAFSSPLPAVGGLVLLPVDTTSKSTATLILNHQHPLPRPPPPRESLRHRHGDECLIDLNCQRGRKRDAVPCHSEGRSEGSTDDFLVHRSLLNH
ncbi:hypothetical protein D623_10030049 [Myotis brandtii]|uniref:Uncharacterized protein n=1 Tax=Myotis brandtii TaxID=109478 RepID=S7MIN3_MYOBR|nr:hypothetical protein D623_10030049 [Myotis brandtii]